MRYLQGGEIIVIDDEPHYVWGRKCRHKVKVERLSDNKVYTAKFPEFEYVGREDPVVFRARKKFGYDTVYTFWRERDCDNVVWTRNRKFDNPDALAEELEDFARRCAEGPWSVTLISKEEFYG